MAALLGLALLVGLAASGGFIGAESSQFNSVGAALNNPGAISVPGVQANQGQTIFAGRTVHQSAPLPGAPADLPATDAGGTTTSSGANQQLQGSGAPAAQQGDLSKIIKDGQIAVTIDKGTFKATAGSVAHIAAVNGGSILSSSTEGGDSGSFTLRIPAANFDKAMLQLAQLGSIDSSASQGQDVTAQYVDLKAHMKIYLSRRRVLFGLMDKATTIGQSLTLQNQLDQVQLKIDQITGQISYINKQVAESTIKVDLHEPGAAAAQSPTRRHRQPELGARVGPCGARTPEHDRGDADRPRLPAATADRGRDRAPGRAVRSPSPRRGG